MSRPVASSGTKACVGFEDLWRQLGECHQNALQELTAKVSKLKKERCLDAQRLEVFFNRNQQLKEQNKNFQDTISSLENRLRAGECERCAILEDNLKSNQGQNTNLINKLKQEKKAIEDENRRLNDELVNLKKVCGDHQCASSPEPDDCIIPDSPVMLSSHPAANKLKKRKNVQKSKWVRYEERPLPPAHSSLFIESEKNEDDGLHNPRKAEVLVPNTCELDASLTNDDVNPEEVIAETCNFNIPHHMKREKIVNQQHILKSSFRSEFHMKPSLNHSPDLTTDRSPSLLPRTKRFSNDCLLNKAKRKKEESQLEAKEEKLDLCEEMGIKKGSQPMQSKLEEKFALEQSFKAASKSQSNQDEMVIERPNLSFRSPVFKKPNATVKQTLKENIGKKCTPVKNQNNSICEPDREISPRERQVEPMWSIDPAVVLEMYESEHGADEEKDDNNCPGESVETDCTWISHKVLQRQAEHGKRQESCDKANDSLDRIFDTSSCREYKSYNTSHTNQYQSSDDGEEQHKDEEEDEAESHMNQRKPGQPTFAHVAVIRKKDERRKLKGTTCKECEIYYAQLPEEERLKKLSNCSRHRFLYIPPCTPENFWEVGFPSTQTCIERGYIKEETNPQGRMRRRQPLNVLFSPKRNQQGN